MKIFTRDLLAQKKIVIIFLIAILLPALIVGYLSFTTLSKRREAVRKLFESHLWISGESALKSLEDRLLKYEKEALNQENFIRIAQLNEAASTFFSLSVFSKDIAGKLFLLDDNCQIVLPKTGKEDISIIPWEMRTIDSEYAQAIKRAEFFEFSAKNYSRAAESYRKSILNAPSKQHAALALEALGRCLSSSKKYNEAYKICSELSIKYGQFLNMARHPYGIVAAFQLYEIERSRKKEENSLKILLDLYKKIRNGVWPINLPTYDFFIAEIESIFSDKRNETKFPEIHKSYLALRKQESSYLQALIFADFLRKEVTPKIKEKLLLSRIGGEAQPGRLLAIRKGDICLVSYTVLDNFQPEKAFYAGFSWDFNFLKKEIFPQVLEELKADSGLHLRIIDEKGQDILTGEKELSSKDSLSLSYRQFPFPWKLFVSQPELNELERTGHRENFFYGVLLAFIMALMLLGAFLIARDISRESETTRLKTEFVHNISHELKTPLTLIRLYGETLQRKENLSKHKRKESYEIITKESERLSHLINNVLDFSRIEMGKKEFDFKKGNLAKVIQDTLESYRYHLEKKGFTIKEEIASDLPEMNFDGEAIASVLINLLSNAMKFSPKIKEVTVKLFEDKGNAVLQVADRGIGISPKDTSRIFKRFYRVKNEIVSETRGSGLGLTLVKHIAEAHGGRIKVESESGKGSVFSVILPLSGPKKDKSG